MLAGSFIYFLVTFMFFTVIGIYNLMVLGFVTLFSLSFFALFLTLFSFNLSKVPALFAPKEPARLISTFQMVNAMLIDRMRLGEVIPPLLDGISMTT